MQVLKKARNMVSRRYGWTRGAYEENLYQSPVTHKTFARPVQCFCAAGAIRHAAGDNVRAESDALAALAKVLGRVSDDNGRIVLDTEAHCKVLNWNDKNDRTQADVIAAFDAAIAKESL